METRSVRKHQLMTTATELLREESCEGLEAVVHVLQTLKRTHGSLSKGLATMDQVSVTEDGNDMDSGTEPDIKSSILVVPEGKSSSSSRNKMFDVTRVDHPFRNSVILKNLFQFCCVETLKSCRLVSKEWNNLAFDVFRTKAVVVIYNMDHESRLFKLEKNFGKPAENVRISTHFKWTRETRMTERVSNLTYLDIGLSTGSGEPLEFIFNNSRELRFLKLVVDNGFHLWSDKKEALQQGSHLLKLKSLDFTFKFVPYGRLESLEEVSEEFTTLFFEKTPALETLGVKFKAIHNVSESRWTASQTNTFRNILRVAMNFRIKNNFSSLHLTELNISQPVNTYVSSFSKDLVQLVNSCQFPLKRLSIDIGKGTKPAAIKSLLESHANTLEFFRTILMLDESLHGANRFRGSLFPSRKLNLPTLRRMEIVSEASTAFLLLGSLDAVKLETVIITQEKAEELLTYKIGQAFCEKLKNIDVCRQDLPLRINMLHLPGVKEFRYDGRVYFNQTGLKGLAKAMPNLKNLQMNICKETFPVVCKLWPGLWTLFLTSRNEEFPVIDDYALTGLELYHSNANVVNGHFERKPNITDLKELTDFTYRHHFQNDTSSWKLTCHSVTHGFLHLPRLHFVDVDFRKLSFDARLALENHVPNCYVNCVEYATSDWKITNRETNLFDGSFTVTKGESGMEGDNNH